MGIVSIYQTRYEPRKIFDNYPELVFEASSKVLEEAGLTIEDMDQIVTNSQDFGNGRTISNRSKRGKAKDKMQEEIGYRKKAQEKSPRAE